MGETLLLPTKVSISYSFACRCGQLGSPVTMHMFKVSLNVSLQIFFDNFVSAQQEVLWE